MFELPDILMLSHELTLVTAQTAFLQNAIQTGATPASYCWPERFNVLQGRGLFGQEMLTCVREKLYIYAMNEAWAIVVITPVFRWHRAV